MKMDSLVWFDLIFLKSGFDAFQIKSIPFLMDAKVERFFMYDAFG